MFSAILLFNVDGDEEEGLLGDVHDTSLGEPPLHLLVGLSP